MRMTIEELKKRLVNIAAKSTGDQGGDHVQADEALLDYIGDPRVRQRFEHIDKWYA